MRNGRENGILNLKGKLTGVNLGADHCAEHEWGIKTIQSKFGMNVERMGLARRQINAIPKDLHWVENVQIGKSKWSGIVCDSHELYVHPMDTNLSTFWDQDSFCALSTDSKVIAELKEIFDAFAKKDIAIWLGGGGVFKNAGFCLAIASRLPKDVTDNWEKADKERAQLDKDALATGIKSKLEKAGKGFFALSPSRDKNGGVHFWLNPCQQNANNYGWFTVAELEQWIEGKGPIPKKNGKR